MDQFSEEDIKEYLENIFHKQKKCLKKEKKLSKAVEKLSEKLESLLSKIGNETELKALSRLETQVRENPALNKIINTIKILTSAEALFAGGTIILLGFATGLLSPQILSVIIWWFSKLGFRLGFWFLKKTISISWSCGAGIAEEIKNSLFFLREKFQKDLQAGKTTSFYNWLVYDPNMASCNTLYI